MQQQRQEQQQEQQQQEQQQDRTEEWERDKQVHPPSEDEKDRHQTDSNAQALQTQPIQSWFFVYVIFARIAQR
jgi:hypothetical protein